ncbi:MAG TPA: polyphosphate kinase 1 [Steroidobacteraceae bacterium]|jgi:polyphosphate kinase|nr:polyphosphate kinase 1 [Steroidobacteraceae bacterium]
MHDSTDLQSPQLYINRELSFLEFNRRVLDQAKDERIPLLERVKFLCISCANLDEFFEIRVAGLKELLEAGAVQGGPDGLPVGDQLKAIRARAIRLVDEQYQLLNDVLMPELAKNGVVFVSPEMWTDAQAAWLADYFDREVAPVLSPLALDPARPFPKILNKSLNFAVVIEGEDGFGRNSGLAVVQAPRSLPRLIRLPDELGSRNFVFLGTIVEAFVSKLFIGMNVRGCYQFRVTRNSDLFVEQEEVDDLLRAVEGELASRRFGDAVRLETAHDCPDEILSFLLGQFQLTADDLYKVSGQVNLNRLMALYDLVDRPELKYTPFAPSIPERLRMGSDVFATIRGGDVLLHHPYQGFGPVADFIKHAASDPQVLAIKQTLYRTGSDSSIVSALTEAAQADKDVTVIIELRARFDEEANIELATKLQEAGAHVMYGVFGYKTHAKLMMVVRREEKGLRRYCHLGTGNYHAKTARLYTDYGLITADEAVGEDIHEIFLQLTGLTRVPRLRKLLQAPFSLHQGIIAKIEREAAHAREGKPARIIAKLNALTEPTVIQALYKASRAGVGIDLIVRGVCCLKPGVPGVSERIKVRSIVGRFLEHSRVYYFENAGEREIYCGSADWMDRNLFRRIEVGFPVEAPELKARVADDLNLYLSDGTQAWLLDSEGGYTRAEGTDQIGAQSRLLMLYDERIPLTEP